MPIASTTNQPIKPASSKWETSIARILSTDDMPPARDLMVASFVRSNEQLNFCYPDLTYQEVCALVFLDGCYWHGCPTHFPTRRRPTDIKNNDALAARGWIVLRLWECQPVEEIVSTIRRVISNLSHTT